MGFSLEAFFEELNEIINDQDRDEQMREMALCECIEAAEKYARECGMIA